MVESYGNECRLPGKEMNVDPVGWERLKRRFEWANPGGVKEMEKFYANE